jgi:hypothetical protein
MTIIRHKYATKTTLALIECKFDALITKHTTLPLISIAQGHFVTVSLAVKKLNINIKNKISTVYNTVYMHI